MSLKDNLAQPFLKSIAEYGLTELLPCKQQNIRNCEFNQKWAMISNNYSLAFDSA